MIVVSVDPIALSIGSLQVRWFGLLAVAAVLLGVALTARGARRRGLPASLVLDAAALALPVGVVFARLFHVLDGWDYYVTAPDEVWQVNLGGLSLWGALIGGGLALVWTLRDKPDLRARIADLAAAPLGLALAIGSIGSFIDGDGQGTSSTLPWATQYTSEASMTPDFGVPRHPVQLYLGLGALLLGLLVLLVPRAAPAGVRAWTFLLGCGALRVALSPLLLQPPLILNVQLDEIAAMLLVLWSALQLSQAALHSGTRGTTAAGGLADEHAA